MISSPSTKGWYSMTHSHSTKGCYRMTNSYSTKGCYSMTHSHDTRGWYSMTHSHSTKGWYGMTHSHSTKGWYSMTHSHSTCHITSQYIFLLTIGDIVDIFVNCNWVDTRWQQYSTHLHQNRISRQCHQYATSCCIPFAITMHTSDIVQRSHYRTATVLCQWLRSTLRRPHASFVHFYCTLL
jgi:hypothetical protein